MAAQFRKEKVIAAAYNTSQTLADAVWVAYPVPSKLTTNIQYAKKFRPGFMVLENDTLTVRGDTLPVISTNVKGNTFKYGQMGGELIVSDGSEAVLIAFSQPLIAGLLFGFDIRAQRWIRKLQLAGAAIDKHSVLGK